MTSFNFHHLPHTTANTGYQYDPNIRGRLKLRSVLATIAAVALLAILPEVAPASPPLVAHQADPGPAKANAWFIELGNHGYKGHGEYNCLYRGESADAWMLIPFDESEFPLIRSAAARALNPPLKVFMAGFQRFNFTDVTVARLRTYKSWYSGFDGLPDIDRLDDFELAARKDEILRGIFERHAKYLPEWNKLLDGEFTFAACDSTRGSAGALLASILGGEESNACFNFQSCKVSISESSYDIDRQKLWVNRFGLMNTQGRRDSIAGTREFDRMICSTPEFATGEMDRHRQRKVHQTHAYMAIDMPVNEARELIKGSESSVTTYLTVKNWRIVDIQFMFENESGQFWRRSEEWKRPSVPKRYSNDVISRYCP